MEAFKILSAEERLQLRKKRASKARKRQRAAGEDDSNTVADSQLLTMDDQHRRHEPVRLPARVGSIDTVRLSGDTCQVSRELLLQLHQFVSRVVSCEDCPIEIVIQRFTPFCKTIHFHQDYCTTFCIAAVYKQLCMAASCDSFCS